LPKAGLAGFSVFGFEHWALCHITNTGLCGLLLLLLLLVVGNEKASPF
jgi:hypothetical protein